MSKHFRPSNNVSLRFLARLFQVVLVFAVALAGLTETAKATPNVLDGTEKGYEIYKLDVNAAPALQTAAPRSLGVVSIISGPYDCSGQTCYLLKISNCPEVMKPIQVYVKIGEPAVGSTPQGTIVFASGNTGSEYWENWSTEAARVISELRTAGYRTAQLDWANVWFYGAPGATEGFTKLGCRPATVMQWIYNKFEAQSVNTAFCAYGHSNGASAVAVSLTQYGLSNILSTALFNGGPNWSSVNEACLWEDPANQNLWFPWGPRKNTDKTYGFPADGTGPCARQDPTFHDIFYHSSIVSTDWSYVYTDTMMAFVFGALDTTQTRNHGMYYYNTIVSAGSPLVRLDIVPNVGHLTFTTVEGANTIRDVLMTECHVR